MRATLHVGTLSVLLLAGSITTAADRPARLEHDAGIAAPRKLSETGLYAAGRVGLIDPRNRPFSPQYTLWSDGASKARWVYLPPGSVIDNSAPDRWKFPVGTRFWKEFTFNGKKVETRFLWRATSERWVFATYIWTDLQDEAFLASSDGEPNLVELAPGRKHSIPSTDDCQACHGSRNARPLGFNTLQLSPDRDPQAIHAEPITPDMLTLSRLIDERRLLVTPIDSTGRAPRISADNPRTRAALGYLLTNCGSCHDGTGEIAALGPVLKQADLIRDGDAVARGLVGVATKWQVPATPEGSTRLVDASAPERSALLVRMRSRAPSTQMPPLGTVLRDQEALAALTRWVQDDLARPSLQASHVR